MEVHAILDCAELAAKASLFRTESRWGLYHYRPDFPARDDHNWFCFTEIRKGADGHPEIFKRAVDPYIIPIDDDERDAYNELRMDAAE
jgi:succinate dehydrogenase/fumarate reductase flavoprotein subunit